MRLDILIQNFYIKSKDQRIKRIESRIPNSTVLCAKQYANIEIGSMAEIETEGVVV